MNDFIYNIVGITTNKFLQTLIVIIVAFLAQAIFREVITKVIKFPVSKSLIKENREDINKRIKTLSSLLGAVITFVIWFIAIVIILGIYGVPIAALITSAGLIGAALAFGLQSIIKDFISGVFIISENQYRIGDYVVLDKAGGSSQVVTAGIVRSISVRTTVLKTDDGGILHIPNGNITNTANYSMEPIQIMLDLELNSDYDITKLNSALVQIANNFKNEKALSKGVLDGPQMTEIISITNKSSTVQISFKTDHKHKSLATNAVWQAIQKSTISLA